jgi:hypothetical protein
LPGLAKVRRVPIATRRALDLVGLRDGWFSSVLERADIVSEGAVQDLALARGYFGSTSLRCALQDDGGAHDTAWERTTLATLVANDANAKLRLLRLAHREAVSRAGCSLGVLTAEIRAEIIIDQKGCVLAIDIDVSAEVADTKAPAIRDVR